MDQMEKSSLNPLAFTFEVYQFDLFEVGIWIVHETLTKLLIIAFIVALLKVMST